MRRGRPPSRVDPSSGPLASFAHTLRERRLGLGIPMSTVAERAGCSPSILGEYERAERAPRDEAFVRDLAGALTLDTDALVSAWRLAATKSTTVSATTTAVEPRAPAQPGERRGFSRLLVRATAVSVLIAVAALVVLNLGDDADRGDAAIRQHVTQSFASPPTPEVTTGSPLAPRVELAPATPLHDGQPVQIAGTGFGASQGVQIFQCSNEPVPGSTPPESKCEHAAMIVVTTDPKGAFGPVAFLIGRSITATNFNNEEVDCTIAPGCTIIVSGGPGSIAWRTLVFE